MKETHKLSIYLIKDSYSTFPECLKREIDIDLESYEIRPELELDGILYVAHTSASSPKWRNLLNQGIVNDLPELRNSSNRAILFLRISERIFCCTFGYGQFLINPACIERNFGLKTSLNTIDPDKLRSMDKAKLDELTVQTRIQSSVITDRGSFNIDVIGDLLRSITGESRDRTLGNSMTGTDAVYISPKITFSDISPIVSRVFDYYKLDRYKDNFDWIDNLEHERSPSTISTLNESLVEALKAKDEILTSLSPPHILDWTNFGGVSFSPKGDLISEFDIGKYYEYKEDLSDFNVDRLKSSYLYIEDSANETRSSVSLMKCINFQTEIGGDLFVRTLDKWYRISKVFSDRIFEEASRIRVSESVFIDCHHNWNEERYNRELADSSDNHSLFDRKLIRCEAVKTSIEACDILTSEGEFIHVKPKNSSSTLSHLFSQGRISAIALNSDKEYRKQMRTIIRRNGDFNPDIIPLGKVNNSDYIVTYATITKGATPMVRKLPFFSLLNLRQSAQFLSEHGFEVRIKKILKLEE